MDRVEAYQAMGDGELWAAQEASNLELLDPHSPFARAVAADRLAQLETDHADGDAMALMEAIDCCGQHGFVMPRWVAEAYAKAFGDVRNRRAGSWDEVFGSPLAKRQRLATARKHHRLAPLVRLIVEEIMASTPDTPIDDALFDQVGERLSIGKTQASNLYYGRIGRFRAKSS